MLSYLEITATGAPRPNLITPGSIVAPLAHSATEEAYMGIRFA